MPKLRSNGRVGARWRADNLTPTSGISWEKIPSENKWVIWLDTYVQGWNVRCNAEISQTPTQWNSKCSKLFNLKPDGGATNKKVHNQTTKKLKKSASDKRTAVKATSELQKSAIGFSSIVLDKTKSEKEQKRTLPSAHKAWLLRTRTHGGVCSSEPMWCLGAPSILKNATLAEDNGWRLCLKTFMPYHARHYAENMYSM